MNGILEERGVLAGLTINNPRAADRHFKLRMEVLVFLKEEKKWIGPYIFMDCTGRKVTMISKDGTRNEWQYIPN